MLKIKTKKAQIITLLSLVIFFFGVLFFLLRGPYLSNSIKRIIVPQLENITRERIIIDKAVINLFPFYVQAKGFNIYDKDGNRLLWITKSRAYIDLLGLLSDEIVIRKLVLKEPELSADENAILKIIDSINKSTSIGEKGKFKVVLKNIKMTEGKVDYKSEKYPTKISASGIFFDMAMKNRSAAVNLLMRKGTIRFPDKAELDINVKSRLEISNNSIEIEEIQILSSESSFHVKGVINLSPESRVKDGKLIGKATIFPSTYNKYFGVKKEKDGVLSFDGAVNLLEDKDSKWPEIEFNINTDSRFHLESLMEILGVNENIKGNLAVKGTIEGSYPDIVGKGTVKLENAIFGTFPLDDAEGEMQYRENEFSLKAITVHTYNGVMTGDAFLSIPDGDYSVIADIADISSMEFFSYLGWEPPFPSGKLKGNFHLVHDEGKDISINASLSYLNNSSLGEDVLSKLDKISATLKLENQNLLLTDTILATADTRLSLEGNIDFKNEAIALRLQLTGQDAAELAAPYYKRFTAPVKFTGIATGSITDPEISGRLEFAAGSVHGIQFTSAFADLIYKIDSLSISNAWIKQGQSVIDLSGLINFRKARKFFSFDDPFFMINASINKFPIEQHISEIYKALPVSGIVDSSIYFEGDTSKFTGNADISLSNSIFYGQEFDRISLETVIGPESISLQSIEAVKNESVFSGNGVIFFDKRFSMDISSPGIRLKDIDLIKKFSMDALIGLKVKGTGTLDSPDIQFSVDIHESTVKGIHAGKGILDGTLTGNNVTATGNLADGRILASLKADFPQFRSWSVDMNFKKERYDFLLSGFLKEIPDNFSLSAEGDLNVSSDNDKLIINSKFNYLNFSMYEYIFENNESVILNFDDDEIIIKSFDFSGNNTALSASGEIKLNNSYDVTIKGNIDIAPLKALTEEFVFLDGRGNFDVDVKGSWDEPELIGKIEFENVSAIFKSFPQGVGPLNGTFLLNRDKVTFDSVTTGFAGGTITLSGLGNFNRLSLERLIVSSFFDGIRIRAVDGIRANINGSLFYETSTKGSNLTGEVLIDKARYEKNIDLKKWFLGLKEIKKGQSRYADFLKQTKLNIQVRGSENIFIDNDLAKAPVKIDLNIAGNVERYGLVGRVEADEGQIYFRGNELRILEGSSVDFVDPAQIYPLFHVLAETYKNDYHIKLSLDGTIDKFTLSLFSDPPLPEADVLTLLTFGHTNKDIQGVEGGIAAQQASAIVTGGIQEDIQNEIKNIVGIERFEVEPHITSTGAFTSKVTVGKRLLEDQISVTYSTAIGTTEEQVIELEYKLNKELSLLGSRDEMGSAGADVKYRFEFK